MNNSVKAKMGQVPKSKDGDPYPRKDSNGIPISSSGNQAYPG